MRAWAGIYGEAERVRPEDPLTVSQWADKHRVLVKSAYPGKWSTDRTPYLREPMNRLGSDDPCESVTLVFGAQLGKSEVANNWIGWNIDHSPSPMLMVQPNNKVAEKYSKMRIAPMIKDSPCLAAKVSSPKQRDGSNTIDLKQFPGGELAIVGANMPSDLASMPIRRVAFDEVDKFEACAGAEGDPIKLAEQRTNSYGSSRKYLYTSTCSVENESKIWEKFERSDQRHFFVPCPHCDEFQLLEFKGVKWDKGNPKGAWYVCEVNGCVIENYEKSQMLPRGEWRPTELQDDGTRVAVEDRPVADYGYRLPAFYAPAGWKTLGDIASEWVDSKGKPHDRQVCINANFAELYKQADGDTLKETTLSARAYKWAAPVPAGASILTAGVDIQQNRIEVEVVGWGANMESWSVAHAVIHGDPTTAESPVWQDLDRYLSRTWKHESGVNLRIAATCVDSSNWSNVVYAFCRPRWGNRVWAVKGASDTDDKRAVWPVKWSKGVAKGLQLKVIGVNKAKQHVYARLMIEKPGPGFCHFPLGRSAEWYAQLTAEARKIKMTRGRQSVVWVKVRPRNEALDLRVYAYAAIQGVLDMGATFAGAADEIRQATEEAEASYVPARKVKGKRKAGDRLKGGRDFGSRLR